MKPINDNRIEELEEMTMESVKQLRAFFKYEGDAPRFFQKARLATGMISAYARLRASETNRMAVELATERQLEQFEPKQLSAGDRSTRSGRPRSV